MRYTIWVAVLITLFMIGFLACTPSHERERLLYIETIIDERPDSALAYLNTIPYDRLRGEEERALYGML